MQGGLSRKTASKKEDYWFRSTRIQFEEVLCGFFYVECNDVYLRPGEDEGGDTREKHRYSIHVIRTERGSGVGTMAAGQTHAQNTSQRLLVIDNPLMQMRKIARHRPQNTHMFGSSNKFYGIVINMDGRKKLDILNIVRLVFRENQKFGFTSRQLHLVLLTVGEGKIKEILELMDVIGDKAAVICLTHSSHFYASNGGSKATFLCSGQLLIVVDLVVLATVWPALLDAQLVLDWPHEVVVPLAEGGPVGETQIPVAYPLILLGIKKESPDQNLSQDKIESRFCIQEKDKQWFRGGQGVLYGSCK